MERKFQIKGIVASGMVLQQNKINCVFGTAGAYEDIYMTFRGMTSITQADETGNWKIEFSPGQAGGPFNMLIKSEKENVTFNDVYVGEVWVNSGQSMRSFQWNACVFHIQKNSNFLKIHIYA